MQKRKYVDADLIEAVATSISIAQVLRKIGLVPAGGNYQIIQRRIKELGLDTTNIKGQGWSRGKSVRVRDPMPLDQILILDSHYQSSKLRRRLIEEGVKEPRCEVCGLTHWINRTIPLEIDHINGEKTDNRLTNLRILCPNCHALTDTYRGKNKNKKSQRDPTIPRLDPQ